MTHKEIDDSEECDRDFGFDDMVIDMLVSISGNLKMMGDIVDTIFETRALNAITGKNGFNVDGSIADDTGKCGICGETIEIGDHIRLLLVLNSKKPIKDKYPDILAHPFHEECATRALLYMFPQVLMSMIDPNLIESDDEIFDKIFDLDARKELIEEVLGSRYEECDDDCDCEECR